MKNYKFIKIKESGQVALIVLVVSAVVMTIGLSLSKRTVIETKISTDEEMLKQAFNAAESGIDYYLRTNQTEYEAIDGSSSAEIRVNSSYGRGDSINYNEYTVEGDTALFWLVGHLPESSGGGIDYNNTLGQNYDGTGVNVCFDNSFNGSVKIDYFYRINSSLAFGVRRYGYNLGAVDQVAGYTVANSLPEGNCGSGRKQLALSDMVASGTTPLLLAIKPIFYSSILSLTSQGLHDFPSQGIEIVSTGKVGNVVAEGVGSTGVNRQVSVVNRFEVPSFLLEGITAGGSVISQ